MRCNVAIPGDRADCATTPYVSQITPRSAKRFGYKRDMDDVVDALKEEEESSEEEEEEDDEEDE